MKNTKALENIKTLFRTIKYVYKTSAILFVLQIFLAILLGVSPVLSVWATRLLINGIVNATNPFHRGFLSILLIYGLVNITVYLIKTADSYVRSKFQIYLDKKTNEDILNKSSVLSLKDFEDSETYDILTKGDTEGSTRIFSSFQNLLGLGSQIISTISVSLLILSWSSMFFLIIFVVPILSYIVNSRINYENYCIRMSRTSEIRKMSYLKYLLTNNIACKEIIAYNTGQYLTQSFSKIRKFVSNQDIGMLKKRTLWNLFLNIIDELINLAVIFSVVVMAVAGKLKIGDSVAIIESLNIIQGNISSLLLGISDLNKNIIYVEKFFELLDIKVSNKDDGLLLLEDINSIEFLNVSYRYNNSSVFALNNVSFRIHSGEKIGIMGENGSGKTTFVKILCGFYTDYSGEVLINDINIRVLNLKKMREKIGIVFQDFNKYEMTLRHNIGFGSINEINDDEKIHQIIDKIQLKDKFSNYANSIDEQMGKWFGGEELSKGQWQRVAIGRTLFRNSEIYILDEPTASLDPQYEREIFRIIFDETNEKICIFITHRLESIKKYNPRILLFSEGTLIGDNFHEVLSCENTLYQRLTQIS